MNLRGIGTRLTNPNLKLKGYVRQDQSTFYVAEQDLSNIENFNI
jgi:hypothetical protein